MIIWINGAFGSGKSSCADELHGRIPGSFIYDPENTGSFIRENIPDKMRKSDFQDHRQWRLFTFEMLKYISSEYDGTIIVPMTLTSRPYYDEIIGRLIEDGVKIKHFILSAEKETLIKRLDDRTKWDNEWPKKQIDRCIYAFNHDITDEKIITDDRDPVGIVDEIVRKSGLE